VKQGFCPTEEILSQTLVTQNFGTLIIIIVVILIIGVLEVSFEQSCND
jgi:hypothetical protein